MQTSYLLGRPLTLGLGTHILAPNDMVMDHWNIIWKLGEPVFHNFVFQSEPEPWLDVEGACKILYDKDNGIFRMWYLVVNVESYRHFFRGGAEKGPLPGAYCTAYAESENGIQWRKPQLDVFQTSDGMKTNIVHWGHHGGQLGEVIENPRGSTRRYAMVYLDLPPGRREGICLAWSDDGIHWDRDPDNPVLACPSDCKNNVIYNQELGRYILITRPHPHSSGIYEWTPPGNRSMRRRIALSTSENLREWGSIRTILYPGNDDPPDFDNMTVISYGNNYVGFLHTFDDDLYAGQVMSAHLVLSRDGLHWSRPVRAPFLCPGFSGRGFDNGSIGVSGAIVPFENDRILLFFSGRAEVTEQGKMPSGRMATISLRRDGFLYCSVGPFGSKGSRIWKRGLEFQTAERADNLGFLLTHEFVVPGPELTLNCDASRGLIRAEVIQGPTGEILEGFSRDDCVAISIDSVQAPVRWKERRNIGEMVGKPIMLRLILDNANVYSFCFR